MQRTMYRMEEAYRAWRLRRLFEALGGEDRQRLLDLARFFYAHRRRWWFVVEMEPVIIG